MQSALPPDCDPRLKRFVDYLASKAPPGKLAGRHHIVPQETLGLLPFVTLYDSVAQANVGPRYRVRLIGTHTVELLGSDPTGKFVDEIIPAPKRAEILAMYIRVVASKQPQYYANALGNLGREHIHFERVAFPLARNGDDVDMLALLRVGYDDRDQQFAGKNSEGG